jgi:MFS family permease
MEPIHVTYNELLVYIVLVGAVIGVLLGLIPLILGIKRKKRNYGAYGFVASVFGGAISPLVSIIVVSIFTWLIVRKSAAEKPVETVGANENPIETNVTDTENK